MSEIQEQYKLEVEREVAALDLEIVKLEEDLEILAEALNAPQTSTTVGKEFTKKRQLVDKTREELVELVNKKKRRRDYLLSSLQPNTGELDPETKRTRGFK